MAYAFSGTLPVASKQDQPVLTQSQMESADLPLHMHACMHARSTHTSNFRMMIMDYKSQQYYYRSAR